MKNFIAVFMIIALVFTLTLPSESYADGLTIAQIAGAAYAIGQTAGITWQFDGGTQSGSYSWMENRINSYLNGRTITEVFGDEIIRYSAGKLIVPSLIYNNIAGFINTVLDDLGIDAGQSGNASQGSADGVFIGADMTLGYSRAEATEIANNGTAAIGLNPKGLSEDYKYNASASLYVPAAPKPSKIDLNIGGNYDKKILSARLGYDSNREEYFVVCDMQFLTQSSLDGEYTTYFTWTPVKIQNKIDISVSQDYGYEDVPDVGYDWEGTIYGAPDTNLEDLLNDIFEDVADNNLDVTGEIVEQEVPPTPVPTPIPIDPDIPLQDVPWEGLNDLIGQTEQGINEQIQSQTQSITSAQDATTEAVESLNDVIEGALDVPDSEELPDFKFDLRELFPFCIPFDIYRLLSSFDAEPVAPHVQLPIVIESIGFSYNLDLDFSAWNPVAQAMRTAELIVYAIALAWATGKVIKW